MVAGNGYLACAFDLINVRDLDLIAQAREHCTRLVVGVYTDEYVTDVAGAPPVVPLSERLALVSHIRGVDEAVSHASAAPDMAGWVVFTVEGAPGPQPAGAVVLSPRRESSSDVLRDALRHQYHRVEEAVA